MGLFFWYSDHSDLYIHIYILSYVRIVPQNSRRSLQHFNKTAPNPDGAKEAVKSVTEQLNSLNPKLKEVNERYEKQMAVVKEFENVLDSAHKDEVPVLKQKKLDLKR